jgi:ribosomal RNA-processing protein 17
LFDRDFVTGFHKRKKKRRKEAQKILQEKERKKKIQDRKRVTNSSLSETHT